MPNFNRAQHLQRPPMPYMGARNFGNRGGQHGPVPQRGPFGRGGPSFARGGQAYHQEERPRRTNSRAQEEQFYDAAEEELDEMCAQWNDQMNIQAYGDEGTEFQEEQVEEIEEEYPDEYQAYFGEQYDYEENWQQGDY